MSPMGLSKSDRNGEVTILLGLKVLFLQCKNNNLGLGKSDRIGEVALLVK